MMYISASGTNKAALDTALVLDGNVRFLFSCILPKDTFNLF